jgi:hypothetical protein
MTKLYCLQREFTGENQFAFYELENTEQEQAYEEIEETISTSNSQEWILTRQEIITLIKILSDSFSGNELNEEMIKLENGK